MCLVEMTCRIRSRSLTIASWDILYIGMKGNIAVWALINKTLLRISGAFLRKTCL